MLYYVLEFQTNGTVGAIVTYTYTDRSIAYQKYYEIMSAASVSDVAKHGAMIITGDLYELKSELAYREPIDGNEA